MSLVEVFVIIGITFNTGLPVSGVLVKDPIIKEKMLFLNEEDCKFSLNIVRDLDKDKDKNKSYQCARFFDFPYKRD